MLESEYQKKVIEKVEEMFPGCKISKNDPTNFLGIPDLSIFYGRNWAMLETKKDYESYRKSLIKQPWQKDKVDMFNSMSFAAYIYPEIESEVLYGLQSALEFKR